MKLMAKLMNIQKIDLHVVVYLNKKIPMIQVSIIL